jgi:hypothetical protein
MISLRQSIIRSKTPADPFALAVWVGTIGGAALGVDPSPNVTPPAPGRIVRVGAGRGSMINHGAPLLSLVCAVVPASSITFTHWLFEDTLNAWQPFVAVTITPNGVATNRAGATVGCRVNQQVFPQITANTLVQAVGYSLC